MHQMHVALELKDQELQGLKTTLESKKKRQKKKKVLPLSPRDPNVQGGAIFWDPASKARADRRMRDAEKQEVAEAAAKANRKQLRVNTKILRENQNVAQSKTLPTQTINSGSTQYLSQGPSGAQSKLGTR